MVFLTTCIQISAGNISNQLFSSTNTTKKKKKLDVFSSKHHVPASDMAGEYVTANVLVITLPTQGEFMISHKALTIGKVILALIPLRHHRFICWHFYRATLDSSTAAVKPLQRRPRPPKIILKIKSCNIFISRCKWSRRALLLVPQNPGWAPQLHCSRGNSILRSHLQPCYSQHLQTPPVLGALVKLKVS